MENIDYIMQAELLFEQNQNNKKGIKFWDEYQKNGVTENITKLAKEFIAEINKK